MNEGNTGTFSDVPADTVTISASVGTVSRSGTNVAAAKLVPIQLARITPQP